MFKTFCIYLLFIFSSLSGLEVRPCYVKDKVAHENNQKLLKLIVEEELAAGNELSSRIKHIANELLKRGFVGDAYAVPPIDQNRLVSFYSFVLWEGGTVPVTFFVYVWPSKAYALRYNPSHPENCRYGSNIHSHPIPCAFAVLKGSLTQNNYEAVYSKSARYVSSETFQKGEGDVDDIKNPFIHKLF